MTKKIGWFTQEEIKEKCHKCKKRTWMCVVIDKNKQLKQCDICTFGRPKKVKTSTDP